MIPIRKKGAIAGAAVLVAALAWVGIAPAQASPSVPDRVMTSGSCTADQSYVEYRYYKVRPKVDEVKHKEFRWYRTYSGPKEIYGATWSNGSLTPTRTPGVWGAVPAELNPPGANSIPATGSVGGGTYNLPQDSDLNTPGIQPWQYRYQTPNGGIQWYPSETGWATQAEFDNAALVDIGYSGNGWQLDGSTWVIDVVGSPAKTVWYGVGGAEVETVGQAVWIENSNPGNGWIEYDKRDRTRTVTVPCAPSGSVTFKDSVCDGANPLVNGITVTLKDGSTAEGFLWNGSAYVSIGNIPAGNYGDELIDDFGFPAQVKIVITGEDGTPLPPFEHTFPTASKDAAACTVTVPPSPTASMTASCGLIHIEAANPLPTAPNTVTTSVDLDVEIDGVTTTLTLAPGETYSDDVPLAEDSGLHAGEVRNGATVLASVDDVESDCQPNKVTGNPVVSAQEQCTVVLGAKVGGADATYTFSFPAVVLGPNDVIDPVTFLYIDGNGDVQEVTMNAGDPDIVKTVHYVEDANGGSKTVQYGIKGQPLKELTVDTDCQSHREELAMTGVETVGKFLLVLSLIGGGISLILSTRKRRSREA